VVVVWTKAALGDASDAGLVASGGPSRSSASTTASPPVELSKNEVDTARVDDGDSSGWKLRSLRGLCTKVGVVPAALAVLAALKPDRVVRRADRTLALWCSVWAEWLLLWLLPLLLCMLLESILPVRKRKRGDGWLHTPGESADTVDTDAADGGASS